MKVSVIIPAYNEEKIIGRCLESILNQKEPPEEIILVDNKSTDHTAGIARSAGIRVVKESKQGLTHARKHNFETKTIDALSGPVVFYDLISQTALPSQIYSHSLKFILKGNRVLHGPNMALTKTIWKKVKPHVNLDDSLVHEDVDLSINITKANGKIGYDASLTVKTSARRIKKRPASFFIEYPIRLLKTFWVNRK